MKRKSLIAVFLLLAVLILFPVCKEPQDKKNQNEEDAKQKNPDNSETKEPKTTFIWTFIEPIPGWVEFDTTKTPDYPAGTTMNIDAQYFGMTLLASQRTTRWLPNAPAPADTDFSDGYIMPNGRTNPGAYSLKIEGVKGPFTLTINYTAREGQQSFPIIFINGTEEKRGEQTTEHVPKILTYEYEEEETVTISLGNANSAGIASAGIRIWDVILYAPGNAGAEWGDDSDGSGNAVVDAEDNYLGQYPDGWPTVLAFPGAEGFGRYASGGRGGKVVAVTNLLDNAANPPEGSFRWALAQHPGEPITVVFRVSGIITLEAPASDQIKNDLRVKRDNFTLAGQTSPGGICITGNKVNFGGSNNVIIRHLRFRIGNEVHESAFGMENATKFIIDHCTFGWSGEENITVYDNDLSTVQWCIVHEGLYNSGHSKGVRGYGTQWGGKNATYHHNLLAHNDSRSPRFNGARSTPGYPKDTNVLIDFVNNVNFNWGRQSSSYGGEIEQPGNSHRVNFVNNYWKPGPARPATESSWFVQAYYGSIPNKIASWWMNGNIMEGNAGYTSDNYAGLDTARQPAGANLKAPASFEIRHPVTIESAEQAYQSVLSKAGAFPRDSVDARIVGDVRDPDRVTVTGSSGKRGIIDQISSVGGHAVYSNPSAPADTDGDGIPDDWEDDNGLDKNDAADGNLKTLSASHYTNLEVYLNELAAQFHE